jgi:hypothetical protein
VNAFELEVYVVPDEHQSEQPRRIRVIRWEELVQLAVKGLGAQVDARDIFAPRDIWGFAGRA